jgi:hypothetical protein
MHCPSWLDWKSDPGSACRAPVVEGGWHGRCAEKDVGEGVGGQREKCCVFSRGQPMMLREQRFVGHWTDHLPADVHARIEIPNGPGEPWKAVNFAVTGPGGEGGGSDEA